MNKALIAIHPPLRPALRARETPTAINVPRTLRTAALSCWSILAGCALHDRPPDPMVSIDTPLGTITAAIHASAAPVTAGHFLRLVDAGVYEGGRASFYRAVRPDNQPGQPVRIEVIQGGIDRDTGDPDVPAIPHETTASTGLSHLDGSLTMAREEPGTANSEFAICVGPQPELDFGGRRNPDGQGFAVFGRVVSGMDVVRRIQDLPDDAQYLKAPVPITGIRRLEPAGAGQVRDHTGEGTR